MGHSILLVQLVVILGVARLLGLLLARIGQPPVIGEMTAGIVLGPIVFGQLAPQWHASLFPAESLAGLSALSQLGLVLFMFIVGVEMRMPNGVRAEMRAAGSVGLLSVLLPMALGVAVAPLLYPELVPAGVAFWPFALFMASAMAITAFPIMARILKERGLYTTPMGRLALSSAAFADVLAWILLALVVALVASDDGWSGFLWTCGGLVALLGVVFLLLRPLYARFLARYAPDAEIGNGVLAAILIGMFACAAVTQWLHLHPVFGAFLFGVCLPRDERILRALVTRVEYIAVVALMPIFFALAGLNTTPDAFVGGGFVAMLLIFAAAVVGKILGGAAGARLAGRSWRESMAVGSLMNARALMELIVIKVGLDAGIIGNEIFTMLMVMAIGTTFMTTPLLTVFMGRAAASGSPVEVAGEISPRVAGSEGMAMGPAQRVGLASKPRAVVEGT